MCAIVQKECFKCHQLKPLDAFYKHPQMGDGHLNKCKECNKLDVRKNYQDRHEQYILYDRARLDNPERKATIKRTNEKRKANPDYQDRKTDTIRQYRANNPDKYKAHSAVNNAIRSGKITKGTCEVCGNEQTQAHHDDYSKPLDVRWLCAKHHGNQHRKSRIAA